MLVKISDTVLINPERVSGIEIVETQDGRKVVIYADGRMFTSNIPYNELMQNLNSADTRQITSL